MAENSAIEWCDHTFNSWEGCEKVSPACANCYAERRDKQYHEGKHWGPGSTRKMMSEDYWEKPKQWNRKAEKTGIRPRVFCSSLADVFEDRPELVEPRRRLFDLINETPNLAWLLLTKRPENIEQMFDDVRRHFDWDEDMSVMNIWLGTTVENQEQADKRIPELLKIPAQVRFLSCEPLLGPVDLTRIATGHWAYGHVDVMSGYLCGAEPDDLTDYEADPDGWIQKPAEEWERGELGIDWVIVGGESGPNARPSHPDWFRLLRDQCVAANVPFFFKQQGEYLHSSQKGAAHTSGSFHYLPITLGKTHDWPDGSFSADIGKKKAGRLLDDEIWNQFPNAKD